ncbi:MAG: YkgJ family cysteine cluster protein [Armatimonadetes bacterium]|nr:YkgJ family cysteine cluster protein [Armatimonadota bacterium]
MQLILPVGQRFECADCDRCCRPDWNVEVDATARFRMRGSYLPLKVQQEKGIEPFVEEDGLLRLGRHDDGACVFLEDKLCAIHREHGARAKPRSCRQFPFLFRVTPAGIVVGTSFYCPSIRENTGRPIESYRQELEGLARELRLEETAPSEIALVEGRPFSWEGYLRLENLLLEAGSLPLAAAVLLRRFVETEDLFFPTEVPSPAVDQMLWFLQAALVARLETDEVEPFLNALLGDRPVTFKRLGWTGRLSELRAYRQQFRLDWLQPLRDRYLRALVERKFLLAHGPVLVNLLLMAVLPDILELYTCLSGLARRVESPEAPDFTAALDIVELNLTTHGRDDDLLRRLLAQLLQGSGKS